MQVIVEVESIQSDDLGNREELSFSTLGRIYEKDAGYSLRYEEELIDTAEKTITTLKIKEKGLTLIRSGGVRMKQEFVANKSSDFKYQTAYGEFNFRLVVTKVELELAAEQGSIELQYSLYNGEQLISQNQLLITYKEDLNG